MRVRRTGNTQKSCCPLGTPSLFQWTLDVLTFLDSVWRCLSQFPTQLGYAQLVRQWSCTRRCGATSKRRHWGWWRWELTIWYDLYQGYVHLLQHPWSSEYHLYLSLGARISKNFLPGQWRSAWQQFAKCSHFGAGRKRASPADCCHFADFAFIFLGFVLLSVSWPCGPWVGPLVSCAPQAGQLYYTCGAPRLGPSTPHFDQLGAFHLVTGRAPSTWCWRAILTTSWVSRGNSFNSKQLDQIVFLPVFVLWVTMSFFSTMFEWGLRFSAIKLSWTCT